MTDFDIVFKHHRDTTNIGDRHCSPFDYFPEFQNSNNLVLDLSASSPTAKTMIFGGGKIMGGLASSFNANDLNAPLRVAWGVSTVQTLPFSIKYWRAFKAMTLIGSRDWGDSRFLFAPCASCLSPYFDAPVTEQHELVCYLHHTKSEQFRPSIPLGVPTLDNTTDDLQDVIRFLSSGRIVVTNSYHGTYWSLLLGKKVLCLPFSKKFNHFRIAPGYSEIRNWRSNLHKARSTDELKDICRNASEIFKSRVLQLTSVS